MDEWIKKSWYIYTTEYYSAIKKNEILPFTTTWTELESIMLSEVRERQIPHDFTHMWNLINKTRKNERERERERETNEETDSFFLRFFIYLFDRETASERGNTSRGSGRGRSRLIDEEPDVGLDPGTLGSRPEPTADTLND